MGGVGSGGWNKKYVGTIDETLRIDAVWLHRQGILEARKPQTVTWRGSGMILLQVSLLNEAGRLLIQDATAIGSPYPDALAQIITLTEQPRNVGGSGPVALSFRP